MKIQTDDYTSKDEASQRKPAELYHFWIDDVDDWYYTSADTEITYDSNDYEPAAVGRESVSYDEGIASSSLTININYLADAVVDYLISNPIALVWVEVIKIFRDQSPYEGSTIFLGNIKNVSFSGVAATVQCTGFEYFLQTVVPKNRYQPYCNYFLYSDKCSVNKESYKTDAEVSAISTNKRLITLPEISGFDDNYFLWGYLESGGESRMIVDHTGTVITLRYPILSLDVSSSVSVYAGCNKAIETCRDKFDNISNFFGFNEVPLTNPATWV